jgi:ParB/RepB/Spo0J family partition protein
MTEKIIEIGLRGIRKVERLRALRPDVVDQLKESMRTQGLLQPIVVRPRGEMGGYFLVAGEHRLEAAKGLEWEAIGATVIEDLDADHALLAEIDENLVRADLGPAERALHTAKRKEIEERIGLASKHGGDRKSVTGKSSSQNGNLQSFVAKTAKATGKSTRAVARDATRGKNVKVLAKVIGTSLDKGEELDALAKLPEASQQALAARAKAGEKVSAKAQVKKERRQEREAELSAKQTAFPEARFGVILADPEWRFEVWSEKGMLAVADNHYPTSTLDAIKARDVPSIAADDCVLFLWATVPMLPQALMVMEAWGFDYKSHCVWAKDRVGTGYWFRNKHEILLVGTRGDVPAPAPGTQVASLIEAAVGEHSAKPEAFLEIIEAYFPSLPKIELNRRGPARPGWSAWGNEAVGEGPDGAP